MNSNTKTHHKLHLNVMVTLNIHKVKKLYIANKLNIKRPKKKKKGETLVLQMSVYTIIFFYKNKNKIK